MLPMRYVAGKGGRAGSETSPVAARQFALHELVAKGTPATNEAAHGRGVRGPWLTSWYEGM